MSDKLVLNVNVNVNEEIIPVFKSYNPLGSDNQFSKAFISLVIQENRNKEVIKYLKDFINENQNNKKNPDINEAVTKINDFINNNSDSLDIKKTISLINDLEIIKGKISKENISGFSKFISFFSNENKAQKILNRAINSLNKIVGNYSTKND